MRNRFSTCICTVWSNLPLSPCDIHELRDFVKCQYKPTRIFHGNSYFKPVLVQVANTLIESKKYPKFIECYRRIKAHRGHKKVIVAI